MAIKIPTTKATKRQINEFKKELLSVNAKKWGIVKQILEKETINPHDVANQERQAIRQLYLWTIYNNEDLTKEIRLDDFPKRIRKEIILKYRENGLIEDSAIFPDEDELEEFKEVYEQGRSIKEKELQTALSKRQKTIRAKRQTWCGKTKAQIKERNQRIIDKFNKGKINPNNFANKYQDRFGLKPSQIRTIIRTAIKK
jgi:hypothetical protein